MSGSDEFRIDHLGIAVRSIESALKFYEDGLGIRALARETIAEEKVNVAMLPVGGPHGW
jgi:methylmalonyl-CoA/ethylmalonyl-CoA epimerase